jgi:hypothetical protein
VPFPTTEPRTTQLVFTSKSSNGVHLNSKHRPVNPWILQSSTLMDPPPKTQVADVLLFSNGDPTEWISTNRAGRVQCKPFDQTSTTEWERFIKIARRLAGVAKGDMVTPICTRFNARSEGVSFHSIALICTPRSTMQGAGG